MYFLTNNKGWHRRSTTRRDIQQRHRRKTCQAAIDLSPKQKWVGVDQAPADLQPAIDDCRVIFVGDLDPLLNDERALQRFVQALFPCCRAAFPADNDALAAVFVVRLQQQPITILACKIQQIDPPAAIG